MLQAVRLFSANVRVTEGEVKDLVFYVKMTQVSMLSTREIKTTKLFSLKTLSLLMGPAVSSWIPGRRKYKLNLNLGLFTGRTSYGTQV